MVRAIESPSGIHRGNSCRNEGDSRGRFASRYRKSKRMHLAAAHGTTLGRYFFVCHDGRGMNGLHEFKEMSLGLETRMHQDAVDAPQR